MTAKPKTARKKKEAETTSPRVFSLSKTAQLTGFDANTLRKWRGDGLPFKTEAKDRRGTNYIDLRELIDWLMNREFERGREAAPAVEEDNPRLVKAGWEIRKIAAEAMKAETDLAERKGYLVRNEDAVMALERILSSVRGVINGIPGRYAQDLAIEDDPAAVERILRRAMDDILGQASDRALLAAALGIHEHDIPDDADTDDPYLPDEDE